MPGTRDGRQRRQNREPMFGYGIGGVSVVYSLYFGPMANEKKVYEEMEGVKVTWKEWVTIYTKRKRTQE